MAGDKKAPERAKTRNVHGRIPLVLFILTSGQATV
jgi:hypothetical protein